ncbi:MAG: hypothetical protein M0Z88_00720 [Actinomycetota bacterium]|nr:hypothetical protein [Actinomycetota bacterium]
MNIERNSPDAEGVKENALALESVVRRAARRQQRFARITASSAVVALVALVVAATTFFARGPARANAASTGQAPLARSQPQGSTGPGTVGPGAGGASPGGNGNIAQRAYFTRTTPSGVKISAAPLYGYGAGACMSGGTAQGGGSGTGGSSTASSATVVPESVPPETISSPAASTPVGSTGSVPYATTPLETAPASEPVTALPCELATPSGFGQMTINVSYGDFTGSFMASATQQTSGQTGNTWVEQCYTLPDGSHLVAVSVSVPTGTATVALLSGQGATLDGPVGQTTGFAGPYTSGGWAILATLVPSAQSSNAAPALSLEIELGASSPFQLSLPAVPALQAAGANGTSVSGSWQANGTGGSPTPQS